MRRALLAALVLALVKGARAQSDDPDRLPPMVSAQLRAGKPWMALSLADSRAAQEKLSPSERAGALLQAGEIRLRLGDVPGAGRDFERALALVPGDARVLLDAAQAARSRPSDALDLAKRAAQAAVLPRRRGAALREAGDILLDLGDASGARRELERALELRPGDLDILRGLVRVSRSEPPRARRFAALSSAAAAAAPAWLRADAWRLSARIWLELGAKPEAASCFREAARAEPYDLDALEGLAALSKEGVSPSTAAVAGAAAPAPALEDDPSDLPALSESIDAALARGEGARARALLERFEDSIPAAPSWQRVAAYRRCARLWSGLDENEAALQCARGARDLDTVSPATRRLQLELGEGEPDLPRALVGGYLAAARARRDLRDAPGARESLERALEISPEAPAVLEEYFALELESDPRKAAALADRLIAATEASDAAARAAAWRGKARALLAAGDEGAAGEALKRALDIQPEDAATNKAASELALARRDIQAASASRAGRLRAQAQERAARGDGAGAREALARALELEPRDPGTLSAAFELALEQGDAARADELAGRWLASSESADAWRAKGLARRSLEDPAGARRALEKALTLAPSDPIALEAAFDLESSKPGRGRQAAGLAARLVEATADAEPRARAAAYRRLAWARLSLADQAGARAALDKALELAPDDRAALRAALDCPCFSRAEREPLADRLISASASADPAERAAAYRLRAGVSLERGDETAALEAARRALELSPGRPDDLWTALYLERGEPVKALALLDGLGASSGPEAAARKALRSMALRLSGRAAEADRELSAALENGGDPVCARSLFRARRERLDLAYLDACVKRLPRDADLVNDRGVARYLAADLDGAAEDFRRVLELRPKDGAARASLETVLADRARLKKRP